MVEHLTQSRGFRPFETSSEALPQAFDEARDCGAFSASVAVAEVADVVGAGDEVDRRTRSVGPLFTIAVLMNVSHAS